MPANTKRLLILKAARKPLTTVVVVVFII